MESSFQNKLNTIIALRQIIKVNYPEKYEELKSKEELFFNLSIKEYLSWIKVNKFLLLSLQIFILISFNLSFSLSSKFILLDFNLWLLLSS